MTPPRDPRSATVPGSPGRALGELGDPAALDALLAAATLAPGSGDLVWALTQFRDARVVGPLVPALHATNETVRWLAASKLGDLGNASADGANPLGAALEPLLTVLRTDSAPAVREQAARALGFTEDQTAVQSLIDAVRGDARPQVREAAAAALGQLRAYRAAEALGQAQLDRHAAVRRAAEAALRRLRPTA
jgi:HEAT repeat protein